jgi:hypothetical protein
MKGRKTFISNGRAIWGIVLVFAIMIIVSGFQTPVCADNTVQRDINEFVEAQGTLAGYFPYDYVGWASAADDPPVRVALVDYAGVTNDALGLGLETEFSGTVTERPLPDGGAVVEVILHTKNALIWVTDVGEELEYPDEWNCTVCPLLFGARGEDVLDGAEPALGNSLLKLKYISKVFGDLLPDLFWTFALGNNDKELKLISVSFQARGFGLLADGSPGMAIVTEIARFGPSGQGGASGVGFTVERVEVKPVSRRGLRRFR